VERRKKEKLDSETVDGRLISTKQLGSLRTERRSQLTSRLRESHVREEFVVSEKGLGRDDSSDDNFLISSKVREGSAARSATDVVTDTEKEGKHRHHYHRHHKHHRHHHAKKIKSAGEEEEPDEGDGKKDKVRRKKRTGDRRSRRRHHHYHHISREEMERRRRERELRRQKRRERKKKAKGEKIVDEV
jgi:hypothetical protein